jgi:hypothetical protein
MGWQALLTGSKNSPPPQFGGCAELTAGVAIVVAAIGANAIAAAAAR